MWNVVSDKCALIHYFIDCSKTTVVLRVIFQYITKLNFKYGLISEYCEYEKWNAIKIVFSAKIIKLNACTYTQKKHFLNQNGGKSI